MTMRKKQGPVVRKPINGNLRLKVNEVFISLFKSGFKGKVSWGFLPLVKNVELRPSLCYKIILEQREERNQLNS